MQLTKIAIQKAAIDGLVTLIKAENDAFWRGIAVKMLPESATKAEIEDLAQSLYSAAVQRAEAFRHSSHVRSYTAEEFEMIVRDIDNGVPLSEVCDKYQRTPGSVVKRLCYEKMFTLKDGYYMHGDKPFIRVDELKKLKENFNNKWPDAH